MADDIPTGLHFTPSHRELIDPYLIEISKSQGKRSGTWAVVSKNVYGENSAPWQILSDSDPWFPVGDKESATKKVIYVYTQRSYVSKNRRNVKRRAGSGCWSGENKGKDIFRNDGGIMKVIGNYKSLTYKPDGITTKADMDAFKARYGHWIMHEHSLAGIYGPSDFVICEITTDEKMFMSQILPAPQLQLDERDHEIENPKKKAKVTDTDIYPVETATLIPQQYPFIPAVHDHQASTSTSTSASVFTVVPDHGLFSMEDFQNNYDYRFTQNNMLPPLEWVNDASDCCCNETLHGTPQNKGVDLSVLDDLLTTEEDPSIELSTKDKAFLDEWINELLQSDQ